MHQHPKINTTMRMIVVDWLVEVHQKFRLEPPTLYLTINIFDRYLSAAKSIGRNKLQLVGVTSLLLASKYEEIYPPALADIVYITDNAYSSDQVLDMECEVLGILQFQLSHPTSCHFLQRYVTLLSSSRKAEVVASYYMDRTLQEYDFLFIQPSMVAAAAICLAINHPELIAEDDNPYSSKPGVVRCMMFHKCLSFSFIVSRRFLLHLQPAVLLEYTGFQKTDIANVATKMAEKVSAGTILSSNNRRLFAVSNKYSSSRYESVSWEFSDPLVGDTCDEW